MNVKKWIIASIVILVVDQALGWLIHGVMLSDMYKATSELWRSTAEMTSMMWMMIATSLVWAFIFVYIFAKGYQGKIPRVITTLDRYHSQRLRHISIDDTQNAHRCFFCANANFIRKFFYCSMCGCDVQFDISAEEVIGT